MMEMIGLYPEQTPSLISTLKESMDSKDWPLLQAAAHKILPSFAIMEIDKEFEYMTKKIQEYTGRPDQLNAIQEMGIKIEAVYKQACTELQEGLTTMNTQ